MNTDQPTRKTLRLTLAAAGSLALFAPPPSIAADVDAGREKAKTCAICHGMDGLSRRPDAPNIAGQLRFYIREQLQHYRSGKRSHAVMSVVARDLVDEDIDNLAAYYSAIRISVDLPP